MRTIAAIVLFAAAGLSPASAQEAKQDPAPQVPFSMDHGRAADAAAAAAANAKAAATAAAVPASPSQPASFSVNGDNVIRAQSPLTPEQQKAEEEGRTAWRARCRPTVVEDHDGMRRTTYAEPDCDLSRFNTAGQ
jgi:hypothetical protein